MSGVDIDIDRLILLVQERPLLWNKSLESYKNRNLTREAWNEICNIFHADFEFKSNTDKKAIGDAITKKWTNIRDSWARHLKKEKEQKTSGSGSYKSPKYIYHDQLLFLKAGITHRDSESNFLSQDTSQVSETDDPPHAPQRSQNPLDEGPQGQSVLDNPATDESIAPLMLPGPAHPKRVIRTGQTCNATKKKKTDDFEERILIAIESQNKEEDPNMNFFKSILPRLRNFTLIKL